ncbi:MAG: PadR family transcriptional regulator [Gemmatimonadaceae bacterium]
MTTKKEFDRTALLQGTLDLLILRTVALGKYHGHGIALAIQHSSQGALLVDHGSLYPALQRLEAAGWIEAEWGVSDNNRRARFYELTRSGRKRLQREAGEWRRMVEVMSRVLGPELSGEV